MDNYREEIIIRRNQTLNQILYVLCWVVIVIFGIIGLFFLQSTILSLNFNVVGIVIFVITGGIAVLTFLKKDNLRLEYEYTFTNGEMDFAKVLGNQKRKEMGTMRVRNVEACGKVASPAFQRYVSMPGIRKDNWFLNRDADLLYFYFQKEGNKRLIIIEPSEEMVQMIRGYLGQGAWQG